MWKLFEVTDRGDILVDTFSKVDSCGAEDFFLNCMNSWVTPIKNTWIRKNSENEIVGGVEASRFHQRLFRMVKNG